MILNNNEYMEFLESSGQKIIVNNNLFKITNDPLLLADFCRENIKKSGTLLDIGAGNGILPLLLCNANLTEISAVEIQKNSFDCLEKNIDLNSLSDKIIPYHTDINDFFPDFEFDYIISNPPYYRENSGSLSQSEEISIAKFEIKMTLDNLILNIKRLLKNHGTFYIIIIPGRLNDVLKAIYFQRLNISKLRTVIHNNKAKFILIEGKKGSRPGDTVIDTVSF
ncbi:tRNA1(Val) (adenine(37)-N6)-methyltransferase [Sebaldella termitidis]|jgi:tRNA1Val (adenine37-N6)-methyltransferase|uniref:Methyltransferase small n=1 Tax=Sebaldella termitidis (strain ATCC 33386 / NCTC 11300) TaxID=526218 RepID=D1ANH8_SEBTE|nr:methyltransferase [Sebaldella termitidis]ACZ09782.1 methyltransferase small [Sebaldella termitidis ATCC 33386]SUI25113.1 tRNA1(Val) (adenine(37)-N6)-methyltransferase [Sebaldella termitidis]